MGDEMSRDELRQWVDDYATVPCSCPTCKEGRQAGAAVLRLLDDYAALAARHERALAMLRGFYCVGDDAVRSAIAALLAASAPDPAPAQQHKWGPCAKEYTGRHTEQCEQCGCYEMDSVAAFPCPGQRRRVAAKEAMPAAPASGGEATVTHAVSPSEPTHTVTARAFPATPEPASDEDEPRHRAYVDSSGLRRCAGCGKMWAFGDAYLACPESPPSVPVGEDEPPPLGAEVAALRERVSYIEQARVQEGQDDLVRDQDVRGVIERLTDLERRIGGAEGTALCPISSIDELPRHADAWVKVSDGTVVGWLKRRW